MIDSVFRMKNIEQPIIIKSLQKNFVTQIRRFAAKHRTTDNYIKFAKKFL